MYMYELLLASPTCGGKDQVLGFVFSWLRVLALVWILSCAGDGEWGMGLFFVMSGGSVMRGLGMLYFLGRGPGC